jgi:ParB-like nuclease domain/Pectate lyase superfamily protein
MTSLPLDQIKVGDHGRGDLGDIPALADSIKTLGLLRPLVVTAASELIAGDRRVAAVRSLEWTNVPVIVVDVSTAAEALGADSCENTCRKGLNPYEAARVRERRARILDPGPQANTHADPAERGVDNTFAFGSPAGSTTSQIWIASIIGTGYSGSELDKVDRVRQMAELGVLWRQDQQIDLPPGIVKVARQALNEFSVVGADVDRASKRLEEALDAHFVRERVERANSVGAEGEEGPSGSLGRKSVLFGLAASLGFVFASAAQTPALAATTTSLATVTTATPGSPYIDVTQSPYNATGNGSTDDTAAINLAITSNPGRTICLPNGTYMINAHSKGVGLALNQPGTRLLLDPGTIVKVITNSATGYVAISVTVADCAIEGGTILGDGPAHTGTSGEWGNLIVVQGGAHRFRVRGVTVKNAWGDGITIQGNPSDVSVVDVIADDNRRQGMSVTSATRLRVVGGVFKNTGLTKYTAPGAGIDVEPNPSSGFDVIDATITGVTFSGNRGAGLLIVRAAAQTTSITVNGCRMTGNGLGGTVSGLYIAGAAGTMNAKVTACCSSGNSGCGYETLPPAVELSNCTAYENTVHGFRIGGTNTKLIEPVAVANLQHGIQLNTGSDRSTIIGGETQGNSQRISSGYANVDLQAAKDTRIIGHVSDAGQNANKPAWGYFIRNGAATRLIGCDVRGDFTRGNVLDVQANTPMFPRPGASLTAMISAPPAPSEAYVQDEFAQMKTAVDAIRAALKANGITL